MAVRLIGQKAMNQVVSHIGGVKAAVYDEAVEIHGRAEGRLAAHHHHGDAKVTVTRGDTDAFVNLEDPAALSIEFGHESSGKFAYLGRRIPGLYIVTGAAGLAG